MKIIVGLGNPGKEHGKSRHNLGFFLLDSFYSFKGCSPFRELWGAQLSFNEEYILCKPCEYMNNSGKTLFKVLSALKIDISQALLVYDELDVVLGKVSLSKKEEKKVSHRGVQDVIVNFPRRKILKLKVGIRPFSAKKIEIRSFVMEDFSSEELEKVLEIKSTIFRIFQGFIDLSEKHMQNPLNYLKKI